MKDQLLEHLLEQECARQRAQLNFIASENYVSADIRTATASVLTNKYAEGYPGKRYYPGCAIADEVEELARTRCRELFKVDAANVQPHSGSSANFAVYQALLNPGDTILGMSLSAGGHLTHGHSVNFSGTTYTAIGYGVDPETELLDYDAIEALARKHQPKLIIAGASAYSRTIDFARFAEIARSVHAYLVADIAHIAGLIATGYHPSPVGYADVITSTTHKTLRGPRGGLIMMNQAMQEKIDRAIMPGTQGGPLLHVIAAKAVCFYEAMQPEFKTYQANVVATARVMAETFQQLGHRIVAGGTDNHLFIIDLSSTAHTGLSAERRLESLGITVSRSCIPNDTKKPWITSGIRIGTAAMATRGMTTSQARDCAALIHDILCSELSETAITQRVRELATSCTLPD